MLWAVETPGCAASLSCVCVGITCQATDLPPAEAEPPLQALPWMALRSRSR